jgi:hypothetical protein
VSVSSILGDAFELYRLLFRRSVATAAIVFTVVAAIDVAADLPDNRGARLGLGLLAFALGFAGTVLVQGALVRIVRNIHEGMRPESVRTLLEAARERLGTLAVASIVYGFGVVLGLLLFIVPGLLAAARWCLMAPLIMLEGRSAGDARRQSSELVRGQTWAVLGALVVTFLLVVVVSAVVIPATLADNVLVEVIAGIVVGSLTAPFQAHVLTVIYYRLVDPEHPVIHEDVRHWQSPWREG